MYKTPKIIKLIFTILVTIIKSVTCKGFENDVGHTESQLTPKIL